MEIETTGKQLRALAVKLPEGQTVHLFLDLDGNLQGVSQPAPLLEWLQGKSADVAQAGRLPVVPKMPDAEDLENVRFFGAEPCWFPGCEELREQYRLDEAKLSADCHNCEKSTLLRKYFKRVREALEK